MFQSASSLAYIARRVGLSYARRHASLHSSPGHLRRTVLSNSNQISSLTKSHCQTVRRFSPRKQKCRAAEISEISPAPPLVTQSMDILGLVDSKVDPFHDRT